MNLQELKSHAYDCLANIEMWTNELKATNKNIAEYKEPVQERQEEFKEQVKKSDNIACQEKPEVVEIKK